MAKLNVNACRHRREKKVLHAPPERGRRRWCVLSFRINGPRARLVGPELADQNIPLEFLLPPNHHRKITQVPSRYGAHGSQLSRFFCTEPHVALTAEDTPSRQSRARPSSATTGYKLANCRVSDVSPGCVGSGLASATIVCGSWKSSHGHPRRDSNRPRRRNREKRLGFILAFTKTSCTRRKA